MEEQMLVFFHFVDQLLKAEHEPFAVFLDFLAHHIAAKTNETVLNRKKQLGKLNKTD
jgi:hypothetical protein